MNTPLLLEVWREVGRHLELPDLMQRLAERLRQALPVSLLVRRVDVAAGCIETVATGLGARQPAPARVRTDVSRESLQAIAGWCRSGTAAAGRDAIAALGLGMVVPEELSHSTAVLVPVPPDPGDAETPPGVLVAHVDRGSSLTGPQRALLASLAEPFAAALANDGRIREMRMLREAALAENRALLSRLGRPGMGDAIIGADMGLKPVLERVALVARSDLPVLILGETGSGKEVIARAIHSRSPRAAGPLIRVNCGAIPPDLVDSELFGHERGSFTGATGTRKGWFERADGGTLLLDEIGELPLAAQVRLLRILQDGSFERVGGHDPLTAHVRVIAATHRDLLAMVRDGRFREDLWYRICVFPIHLPALRERPDDIAALATHFALKAARRLSLPPALPTQEDLALLRSYPWPGNVRELNVVIERAAILGDGRCLEVATALGALHRGSGPLPGTRPESVVPVVEPPAVAARDAQRGDATLVAVMARHIEAALAACHGRVDGPFGAAQRLGVNPHTLRARMRKLGIDWKRFRTRAS
jgi:transcriptional regulator with GAF, ATPase, and Fis domain